MRDARTLAVATGTGLPERGQEHIFIEKPPGLNMDEVQQIHDAAVANDVICAVGFQRRHAAVTREAMRQVAKLGPVSTAVGILPQAHAG